MSETLRLAEKVGAGLGERPLLQRRLPQGEIHNHDLADKAVLTGSPTVGPVLGSHQPPVSTEQSSAPLTGRGDFLDAFGREFAVS